MVLLLFYAMVTNTLGANYALYNQRDGFIG
jgi:hypothetical protein